MEVEDVVVVVNKSEDPVKIHAEITKNRYIFQKRVVLQRNHTEHRIRRVKQKVTQIK